MAPRPRRTFRRERAQTLPRRAGLTTRGQAFLGAGLTLIIAGVGLGLRDFTRVGALICLLPLVALLLDRKPLAVRVTREAQPATVEVGEVAYVQVTYVHEGPGTTSLLLATEPVPPDCGASPRATLGALGPGGARALRYAVQPQHRGRRLLGPTMILARDPFGLTARYVPVGRAHELLVVPRTWPLEHVRARGGPAGSEGERPYVIATRGDEDQSVREYRDGDDRRRIHWPATARTGEFMVRHEDRPGRRRAVVILDTRASAFPGPGGTGRAGFEWAVSAATSIVVHLISEGYAVTLVTGGVSIGGEDASGDAITTGDPADAARTFLAHGAIVETSKRPSLSLAIASARAIVTAAALMVLVVGDEPQLAAGGNDDLHELAALRPPGGDCRAIVVRSSNDPVSPTLELLRRAGWAATAAHPSSGIPEAWTAVTRPEMAAGAP